MDRQLFGTDGIRGLAGEYPLDAAGARRVGQAVGTLFAKPDQRVVIGQDTRESSAGLVAALADGLISVGVNAVIIGVIPTPGLAYITREREEFVAGIMVTASHNPYQYNGIKVFDAAGGKLSDKTEAELNAAIEQNIAERSPGRREQNDALVKVYEDFLVHSAAGTKLDGLKIAIDTANGAASGLGGRVFSRLGAVVTPMFTDPDGRNINDGCGATDTAALQASVKTGGLDLGIAVDGDADRLMLIDAQGREVNGDHVLYLLACANAVDGVVATVMSNFGLEQALARRSIKLERTQVGDRYVLDSLAKTGFRLGGEQSGHIILPELLKTGDGLLAAVQVLRALQTSGRSLAEWRDELPLLPQAVVNIPLSDKTRLELPQTRALIAEQNKELDGKGRLLIRPSGTEPVVRVMVEAPDAKALAEAIAQRLQEVLI